MGKMYFKIHLSSFFSFSFSFLRILSIFNTHKKMKKYLKKTNYTKD